MIVNEMIVRFSFIAGVLQGKPTITGGVILTTRRDGAADPVGQGTQRGSSSGSKRFALSSPNSKTQHGENRRIPESSGLGNTSRDGGELAQKSPR